MSTPKPPEILDKVVDMVLTHRPKPKSKAAKKRKKAKRQIERSSDAAKADHRTGPTSMTK
jgi:hypothetical protein